MKKLENTLNYSSLIVVYVDWRFFFCDEDETYPRIMCIKCIVPLSRKELTEDMQTFLLLSTNLIV